MGATYQIITMGSPQISAAERRTNVTGVEGTIRARNDDVTWRKIDSQTIILDLKTSCYLKTNVVGSLLWEQLQTPCDMESLAATLVETYGIEHEVALHDADQFLDEMNRNDLLVVDRDESPGS